MRKYLTVHEKLAPSCHQPIPDGNEEEEGKSYGCQPAVERPVHPAAGSAGLRLIA